MEISRSCWHFCVQYSWVRMPSEDASVEGRLFYFCGFGFSSCLVLVLFFMTPSTILVPFQLKSHLILTCANITNQTLGVLLTDTYNAIGGHEYTKAVALCKTCIMNVLQERIDEVKSLRCQSSSASPWYNPPWQPWNPKPLMEINSPILSIFPLMEDSPRCTWCQSTMFLFC